MERWSRYGLCNVSIQCFVLGFGFFAPLHLGHAGTCDKRPQTIVTFVQFAGWFSSLNKQTVTVMQKHCSRRAIEIKCQTLAAELAEQGSTGARCLSWVTIYSKRRGYPTFSAICSVKTRKLLLHFVAC